MRFFSIFLLVILISFSSSAHGDLHERIVRVSDEISANPNLDSLYTKRAKLYYYHADYINAEKDFLTAIKLGYYGDDLNFWQARLYLNMEHYQKGIKHINSYLSCYTNDVSAIRIKAQLLEAVCEYKPAAYQYQKVIELTSEVLPKNYLELVAVLKLDNRNGAAVTWLKKGINQFGSLPAFQAALIDIYRQQNNDGGIIAIYQQQLKQAKRKETYYYKLAIIYGKLGKQDSVYFYLNQTELAINQLPLHIKQTDAMQQLAKSIKDKREAI